jgi:hypothetical protein
VSLGEYHKKEARPCVDPRGPSTGRDQVRQSFSRLMLIAPRLIFIRARIYGRA